MIVRAEQENVIPRAHSSPSSSSRCMVLSAPIQSFMEHDRALFNGATSSAASQASGSNISEIVAGSNVFDDEREIEAAAAASEAQLKSPFVSSSPSTSQKPANPTYSPLHINVNEASSSRPLPQARNIRDCPSQRPSTSTHVVMGPPTNSNAPVLLSPAGNLHNGYQRMSSGDSAPSSPGYMPRQKVSQQFTHPLSVQRSLPPPPHRTSAYNQPNRPSSSASTTSPQNGRKEHEMTRRRALVDRIAKSRGAEYVHLLPQVEGLTTTQTSILLRKHRGSLQANGMPYSLQQLIDCGAEPDRTAETFMRRVRETNLKRVRNNDCDEETDVSDQEELDIRDTTNERKSPKDVPRWTAKRVRYCGMLSRVETLLAEKVALMGMLANQRTVMNASCGVRFAGEELISRRRRQLNGMYYLYDKTPFRRTTSERFGCARAMPLQSWTRRRPHPDVFTDAPHERAKTSSSSAVIKPTANPMEKWVATAQYNTVSYLTNGEKREVPEYDYEEYKTGEGLQQVNELSSTDPVEFIVPSDFTPFEERQMEYLYRLSTAPSSTIRKKHGRAIYFETDDRKHVSERDTTKNKTNKKKERKRLEEVSSDEETWTIAKASEKKKPRGRPAAVASSSRKRPSRTSTTSNSNQNNANRHNGIYLDYLFEDYMNEDICTKSLPSKITYAHIHVPEWSQASECIWDEVAEEKSSEELLVSVAKQHHKLMHIERERVKRETEKRNRGRPSSMKSAAATPAHHPDYWDEDGDFPPFDMRQFEANAGTSRRRFTSVEPPFERRDFLKNHTSPPTTESNK